MLNILTKKAKRDDPSKTYIWHYILDHVNETWIAKLHKQAYLYPLDYESFETCKSCLLENMTKTPFTGEGVRTGDLLSLIHLYVCGPMNT